MDAFVRGRQEHVFMLRCEGITYREIARRIGVSPERARQIYFRTMRDYSERLFRSPVQMTVSVAGETRVWRIMTYAAAHARGLVEYDP